MALVYRITQGVRPVAQRGAGVVQGLADEFGLVAVSVAERPDQAGD
jgi:hypothetical protein